MAVSEVIPICPTIESLCDPIKGRPRSSIKNDVKRIYHCPIETCKYFQKGHHFEKMKFLRQHFVKVHKSRTFACEKCGVQFPLESTLSHHKLTCGISYQCYCSAKYKSYEALLTHFKRKHNQNAFVKYKDMMGLLKAHSTAQNFQRSVDNVIDVKAIVMKKLVCPKLLLKKKSKTALSKETQTGMKMCKILPNVATPESPEPAEDSQPKKTVSMQTSTEFVQRKRKRSRTGGTISTKISSSTSGAISFSTSSTQTTPVKQEPSVWLAGHRYEIEPRSYSSESYGRSFDAEFKAEETQTHDSFGAALSSNFDDDGSNLTSQLGQKRMISADDPNFGFAPSSESQDEAAEECDGGSEFAMSDLIKPDFNLIMCSDSETQTPFEDYFDSSYMDTYTQTCDSFFSDLDFVDIETQTF